MRRCESWARVTCHDAEVQDQEAGDQQDLKDQGRLWEGVAAHRRSLGLPVWDWQASGEHAALVDERPRVAHKGSAAEVADLGREFEPKDGPNLLRPKLVERDLGVAAEVEVHPIEVPLDHGQKRAGKLEDECREVLEQRHWEWLNFGCFAEAAGGP